MKPLDRLLQRWRISKAAPYIEEGARVLDVGCSEGELFERFADRIGSGVGIDDDLQSSSKRGHFELVRGTFPESLRDRERFDTITMLAVLEHVPKERQPALAQGCFDWLEPGGHLVITTPSPLVDHILDGLKLVHLIDGMSLEEHYGFEPRDTPAIFTGHGFRLVKQSRFQLGLNYLFVFRKDGNP